jgi:phenylalanyl-tRNA synthetase beta chain
MNVPEHWLRSFCNPSLKTAKLAHLLTMSGLEVEACTPVAPPFSGVVAGEILSVERHPGADKLTVCVVNAGREKLQVVCGAPNVRAGMKAPLALVGTELGGLEIKAAMLRGVESHGMLCSARELGLRRTMPACSSCRRRQSRAWTCASSSTWTSRCSPSS